MIQINYIVGLEEGKILMVQNLIGIFKLTKIFSVAYFYLYSKVGVQSKYIQNKTMKTFPP